MALTTRKPMQRKTPLKPGTKGLKRTGFQRHHAGPHRYDIEPHIIDGDERPVVQDDARFAARAAAQIASELHFPASIGFAAEADAVFLGFALFRYYPPESELLRLVVHPLRRRKKVASSLLCHGLDQLSALGCDVCFLEVRASNLAARQLYAAQGFHEDGRRKRYYSQPEEDALLFHRDLH